MRRVVLVGSSFPTTCARRLRVAALDILWVEGYGIEKRDGERYELNILYLTITRRAIK
jgi:hypothetical protein